MYSIFKFGRSMADDDSFIFISSLQHNVNCNRVHKSKQHSETMTKFVLLLLVLAPLVGAFGVPSRRQFVQGAIGSAAAIVAAPALAKTTGKTTEYYTPAPHSLDGKLMVVTGGTAGLGLETGKRLASAGASVVLTSRTASKGSAAVDSVKQYAKERGIVNDKVYSVVLDLDDLESVKTFTDRLSATVGPQKTNVLINNAGVMAIPDRELTKDGFERTFQSNHLGHFVLTAKMMDKLAPDARIINVSSEAYLFASGGIDFQNLNGEKNYGPWSSYGQSKLANIFFTNELQQRADAAGRPLTTYSLHPGVVQTDLARNMMGTEKWESMKKEGLQGLDKIFFSALAKLTLTVEDGASTQVYLAAAENLPAKGGAFFTDMKIVDKKKFATNTEAAGKLWTVSEQLGQVEFKL